MGVSRLFMPSRRSCAGIPPYEAHSSHGGRTAAKMNIALSEHGGEEGR